MKYGQTTVRQDMLGIGGNRQDTGNRQETRTPGLNFRLAKKQGPGKTRSAGKREGKTRAPWVNRRSFSRRGFIFLTGRVRM